LEEDSERKAAFEEELSVMQDDLNRLCQYEIIPHRFPEIKVTVQVAAFGVLAAMLGLIG
jgi:hypothetical protein